MKNKLLILTLAALSVWLMVFALSPTPTSLSGVDVERIVELVAREANEPILAVRPQPHFKVVVKTGFTTGNLDGGGQLHYLSWGIGGWKLDKSVPWHG